MCLLCSYNNFSKYCRILCTGVESSDYGIFGSIPPMEPVGAQVPRSFPAVNVRDSDGLSKFSNIFSRIARMGKHAHNTVNPSISFLFLQFQPQS